MQWQDVIVFLLVGATAYYTPTLIFDHPRMLNRLFGWHFVWLFVDGKPYRKRIRQDRGLWLVPHGQQNYTLLTRGYTMDPEMEFGPTWRPITWDDSLNADGSPVLLDLDTALKLRRDLEVREAEHGHA